MPYALLSDQHAHAWSAYSTRLPGGVNSRLQIMLDEIRRAAAELRAIGGDTLVFAGDLFHSRGSLDPEVLNPVAETLKALAWDGFNFVAIPGNHDLKSNETTELGNAIQSLSALKGFRVVTEADELDVSGQSVVMVPWISRVEVLKKELESIAQGADNSDTDLVIHAGIDGVLSGVPAHGLTAAWLAGLCFRRVFAGHYHHHCVFEAGKVVSIGATAHQTWSDVGTKAGFLLVHDDKVVHRASRAPSFVEINEDTDADDIPALVDGHYVRVRGFTLDDTQVTAMRRELEELGAAGVTFQTERTTASARVSSPAAKGVTLETSVDGYISRLGTPREAAVRARAAAIIADVRATAE